MRAPEFWNNPTGRPGWQAIALAPLAWIYARATARRLRRGSPYTARVPVICVGNVNAGGTGKTPTVIALAQMLSGRGHTPHAVSRGFGGRIEGPVQVSPERHKAEDTGDEPLLLAAFLPTWVAKDRADGVRAAEAAGASVVILDDGFQNPSVAKSLSIVVVDAETGFGNGRVIPAGPLREPAEVALKRADLILAIGDEAAQARFASTLVSDVPLVGARLEPLRTGMEWDGLKTLAFAGIGRPEKFFRTLRGLGADLVRAEALSDHQPLTSALMARLELEAAALGAQLVTTEKDAVRLPASFRLKVLTLPVRLTIEEPSALVRALDRLTPA